MRVMTRLARKGENLGIISLRNNQSDNYRQVIGYQARKTLQELGWFGVGEC